MTFLRSSLAVSAALLSSLCAIASCGPTGLVAAAGEAGAAASEPTDAAGTSTPDATFGSRDGSRVADGGLDAPTDASLDASSCSTLVASGAMYDFTMSPTNPPPASGGTISDGVYRLVSATMYTGLGGSSGVSPAWGPSTLRVTGTDWEWAAENPSEVTRFVASLSATSVSLTYVCGAQVEDAASVSFDYSASSVAGGAELDLLYRGPTKTTVYLFRR